MGGDRYQSPAAESPSWPYRGLPYRGLPYRGLPYRGLPYRGRHRDPAPRWLARHGRLASAVVLVTALAIVTAVGTLTSGAPSLGGFDLPGVDPQPATRPAAASGVPPHGVPTSGGTPIRTASGTASQSPTAVASPSPSESPSESPTASAPPASLPPTGIAPASYEAESGSNTRTGGIRDRNVAGASGGKVVGNVGQGAVLRFNAITVLNGGRYTVKIYYIAAQARTSFVRVNGIGGNVPFPVTGRDWNTVGVHTLQLDLAAGSNTIEFGNDGGWTPDWDRIEVS